MNLAITYANLGKKTLLIDADLRKPITHKIFKLGKDPGLTRYISGIDEDLTQIIDMTEVENLSIITCGVVPPNPSEILASFRMEKLIENKAKF